ncbi:MAG: sigma-70 family RNA polymerase sigma factor [Demequinaceae bacterium]|nr:sigma-70 family RNA polymerase sigma factor [Demequinaceae bacterium]
MSGWQPVVEELIDRRGARLVAYAAMLVSRDGDAEDLVQDALFKCFSRRRSIATVGEAEGYVRRAMQTIAIDRARTRGSRLRATTRGFAREPAGADLDAGLDVRLALRELAPRERVCIVMKYFDDLTIAQIAEGLGLADGTVKRYLANATARLVPLLDVTLDWDHEPESIDVLAAKEGK